jgi:hypothetical protein
VGAGSGHCIHAPNGEREGIVRSGFAPQGVRPVFVKARGLSSVCPRFVVFWSAHSVGMTRPRLVWVVRTVCHFLIAMGYSHRAT